MMFSSVYIYEKDFSIKKSIKSWIEFKNENLTRQKYDYSCGSASLSTVLKYYYGVKLSEKNILDDILTSKGLYISKKEKLEEGETGLSFLDLANYSHKKGFKAVGLAIDMESLKKLKAPVILFVKIRKNEHFTIYKNIDKEYVYLADPSFGNIKVKISKFKEMFFQREDLNYPGKILAILPVNQEQKKNIKYQFMNIQKGSTSIYENIENSITRVK